MKSFKILAAMVMLGLQTPALAQASAPVVERNASVFTAEGIKLGRVDTVVKGADGATTAIRVIYRGKFLTIPATSLSADAKGLKTSLTNSDIKKM
jgi:hypothetical protein